MSPKKQKSEEKLKDSPKTKKAKKTKPDEALEVKKASTPKAKKVKSIPVPEQVEKPALETVASKEEKKPKIIAKKTKEKSIEETKLKKTTIVEKPKKTEEKKVPEKIQEIQKETEVKKPATGKKTITYFPENVKAPVTRHIEHPKKPEIVPAETVSVPVEKSAVTRPKIKIDETITVSELATKMNVKTVELIKKLMSLGVLATINQRIGRDVVSLIASEFGYDVEIVPLFGEREVEEKEDVAKLKPRAPIVTIMGHVDHGKTSLMDAIRESNVAEKEAGGITQHIGAYKVKTQNGEIVFLDTPGHEAFTAMRARGAQATDIVILVVAADDGVMPQTVEAIDHARAANVPIIVAINKVDLPTANVQKVKQELSGHNLLSEDWGGKIITVEVSARKNTGIDKLLELILLQSEIMELKANPDKKATGVIVEAKVSPKVGPVATVLVKNGTLKVGDFIIAGTSYAKVRAMHNDKGKRLLEAGPSTPVEMMGFQWAPQSGDKFFTVSDEKEARSISEMRQQLRRDERLTKSRHLTLEDFHKNMIEGKAKQLNLIIKADVRGSVEVLRDSLEKLATKDVAVKIIHFGIGGVNDSDVILAAASDAVIIGFNVRSETSAMILAQKEEIEIKTYRIIYEVINDVKAAMEGLLEPDKKEVYLGRARVLKIFKVAKLGTIAGCTVIDGKITRTGGARLLRDNTIVFEGKLGSLKRFKDDAKEVEKGFECGLMLEGFSDVKIGDVIESFAIELVKRKL
ncbi:MAG: translation initiation factor IF-2 [Elusimicrobia bacterium RIFOXYD2_FULL_34_15]|nr:MAG: translation initiation factor IF-2 [Elusimicrobia bacterium RIFOXYD2_FULL_34_15]